MKNIRLISMFGLVVSLILTSCTGALHPGMYSPAQTAPIFAYELTAEQAMNVIVDASKGVNGTLIMRNIQSGVWIFAKLCEDAWEVVVVTPVKNREMVSQIRYSFNNFSNVFAALGRNGWATVVAYTPAVVELVKTIGVTTINMLVVPVGAFKNIVSPGTDG